MLRIFGAVLVTMVFFPGVSFAEDDGMGEPFSVNPNRKWPAMEPEAARAVNAQEPVKVRIGLKMTVFRKMVEPLAEGKLHTRFLPDREMAHTLRARLDKVNHFFVDQFHIEARPVSWIKKARKYTTQLTFFRRYGAFGQLEENIGSVTLSGVLADGEGRVYVLYGDVAHRFRDKFGSPILDVVAGYKPGPRVKETISQAPPPKKPEVPRAEKPRASAQPGKPMIRGRF